MLANRLRAPLALALVFSFASAHAQLSISNGSSVTEDFATLASTATSGTVPTGWAFLETGTNANTTYAADTGSTNSGNTYSYGAAGNNERAFGFLRSSSLVPTLGAQLVNSGGTAITSLEVSYVGEQWRLGLASRPSGDRLDFQYSTDATSLGNGTWTDVNTLDFTSPVISGTVGALNGNVAANRTVITGAITGINIAPGDKLWVRWSDLDIANADDGLAIDDVRFGQAVDIAPTVASTVPANGAASVALNAVITINFSEPVTAAGAFALDCAGPVAFTAGGGPQAYTLTPNSPLPSNTSCTVTVESDLVADIDGTVQPMAADYSATFTTVTDAAPTLVSTVPVDNATGISRAANLAATFSEPVTAAPGAFVLECPAGSAVAFATDTDDEISFAFDPAVTLPPNAACVFTVDATKVADKDGVVQPLAQGAVIDFQTAPIAPPVLLSSVPMDGATNFPAAGDIVLTFDQSVTVGAGAFQLVCAQTTGIVLSNPASGTQIAVNTGTALIAGDTCTFTIESTAITADGLPLAADIEIDFTVVTTGPGGYYAPVDTSTQQQLRCTLHDIIDGHTVYPYSAGTTDTWDVLEIADEDPNNSGRVLDIYRNESYPKYGAGNNDYNREHTWPNSLGFANQSLPAYTDTHMLYISNDTYNSTRGNTPYGNCTSSCTPLATLANNGFGGGGTGTYPGTSNWYNGQQIFEVWNHRKGDAARAILYMAIRYEGGDGTPNLELTNNLALVDTTPSTASFAYMGKLDDLLAWHQADPPDALELMRNEAVAGFQGNRNPFIDHPEWGTAALFASTTPASCSPPGVGNVAPASNDDVYNAVQNTPLAVNAPGVLANDSDAQALTAMLVADVRHGTLALAANGGFVYTPANNYCGSDDFVYQANDGSLRSATTVVTLTVTCGGGGNQAPVANDATFALPENSTATTAVGTVSATDPDVGQSLSYAITGGNAAGAFAINAGTGAITVANAAPLNFETTPQFVLTVTVTDNGAPPANDPATITINLGNVDEGTAQANDDVANVGEDSGLNAIPVLANDTADPDGGATTVTGVGAALHGATSFGAGNVSYTPAANYCGSDSFTYTVSGGDTANVAVTVTCVNDAPFAGDANFQLPENTAAGVQLGQVLAAEVDAGQTLAYAITAGNSSGAFVINATNGTISVGNPASLDFESTPQFVLTVTVSDNGTPEGSDTATVTINLTNVDEGPGAANDDAVSVAEDSAATTVAVLANDAADPDGGALAVIAVSGASHGTTSFTAGNVSYTPAANYCGSDSFTYTITGGDTATVAVTVTCVNDPPTTIGALPDRTLTVGQGAMFDIAAAFQSGDTAHTFQADNLPPGLSVNSNGGFISGTPTTIGVYTVTARAVNGAGSATQTFTITVVGVSIFGNGFED